MLAGGIEEIQARCVAAPARRLSNAYARLTPALRLQDHAFFSLGGVGLDWHAVANKSIKPPPVPRKKPLRTDEEWAARPEMALGEERRLLDPRFEPAFAGYATL